MQRRLSNASSKAVAAAANAAASIRGRRSGPPDPLDSTETNACDASEVGGVSPLGPTLSSDASPSPVGAPSGGPSPVGGPQGCDLAFKRVSCSVKRRADNGTKETAIILHPISGVIRAGSVVALMGPSGSGKTTLLDALAGKKKQYEGDVFLNGLPVQFKYLKQVAIYVPQEAIYSGQEIVREVLEFSASLKTNYSKADRNLLVDGALEFLGLTKVADKRVGNVRVRGISGGQRQRLMAGQALVSLAQLCFCDEPTSGLSSTDSVKLLEGMRRVALQCGVSFIVVIHQPRVEVFNCFDSVILLCQGRCVYQGPRTEMEDYFTRLGHPLELYENPAECYIELLTPGCETYCFEALAQAYEETQRPKDEEKVERHLQEIQERRSKATSLSSPRRFFSSSGPVLTSVKSLKIPDDKQPVFEPLKSTKETEQQTDRQPEGETTAWGRENSTQPETRNEKESETGVAALCMLLQDQGSHRKSPSWLKQYWVLQQRGLRRTLRDKRSLALSVFSVYFFSIITGVLFLNTYNKEAVFYQLSAHILMCFALSIIPFVNTVMYLERKLQFMYETSDGYYSPGPYLLAEGITSCLFMTLMLFPSLIIIFAFCGFPFSRFPQVFLLYFAFEALVDSLMQLCAALLDTFMGINAVGGGWLFLTSVINGLNVNPRSVPTAFRFMVFLSPYFYLFEGIAIALYENNHDIFDDPERAEKFGYPTAHEMFKAFGLAGTFANTSLSPTQWLWLVDFIVLFSCTIAVHTICLIYWMNKRLAK